MAYADVGRLIRDARQRHRLSQAALARRAGTSPRHVGRIERGEVSPSVETVDRLLRCMGERLQLAAVPGPADNRTTADVRDERALSPPGVATRCLRGGPDVTRPLPRRPKRNSRP